MEEKDKRVSERDMKLKEESQSLRGTWPNIAGFEDGAKKCKQHLEAENSCQSDNHKIMNSSNKPNKQENKFSSTDPGKEGNSTNTLVLTLWEQYHTCGLQNCKIIKLGCFKQQSL